MATAKYIGNPEFKTEEEKMNWLAKLFGCKPEQIICKELSTEQFKNLKGEITETDMGDHDELSKSP